MANHTTVVLIPAYCPDMLLVSLIDELSEKYDVCVVNDGSGAKYNDIFAEVDKRCPLLSYEENHGKGYALKYGFAAIKKLFPDAKYVITADADGQHKPDDISGVERQLISQGGGVVIGSRRFTGDVPLRSKLGNTITKYVFAAASGKLLSDTQTGLRGFGADLLDYLCGIRGDRYEYEMNMLMRIAEDKLLISEVPIETVYLNDNASSHFDPLRDSARIYKTIFTGSTAMRFVACSLAGFAVYYLLALILCRIFAFTAFSMEIASTIGWVASSQVNFWLNRRFAFRSEGSIPKEMGEYYALAVVNYLVKVFVLQEFFYRLAALPLWLVVPICEIAMYIINYIIEKKFIFRRKR